MPWARQNAARARRHAPAARARWRRARNDFVEKISRRCEVVVTSKKWLFYELLRAFTFRAPPIPCPRSVRGRLASERFAGQLGWCGSRVARRRRIVGADGAVSDWALLLLI